MIKRRPGLSVKIENSKLNLNKLFDIAKCKCKAECLCINEENLNINQKLFLKDQRSLRKLNISKIFKANESYSLPVSTSTSPPSSSYPSTSHSVTSCDYDDESDCVIDNCELNSCLFNIDSVSVHNLSDESTDKFQRR